MTADAQRIPDGITDDHQRTTRGIGRHASVLPLVVLSTLVILPFLGLAGHETTVTADTSGTRAEWHGPAVIRNGEFTEFRLQVTSHEGIGDLTVVIPHALWEDVTINAFYPAASEETSEDGMFAFTFGPLDAGTTFFLKIDGQLNPDIHDANRGDVRILDGEEELLSLPVSIEVLP